MRAVYLCNAGASSGPLRPFPGLPGGETTEQKHTAQGLESAICLTLTVELNVMCARYGETNGCWSPFFSKRSLTGGTLIPPFFIIPCSSTAKSLRRAMLLQLSRAVVLCFDYCWITSKLHVLLSVPYLSSCFPWSFDYKNLRLERTIGKYE